MAKPCNPMRMVRGLVGQQGDCRVSICHMYTNGHRLGRDARPVNTQPCRKGIRTLKDDVRMEMAAWTISVLEDVHEDFCSLQLISTKDPHKIHAHRKVNGQRACGRPRSRHTSFSLHLAYWQSVVIRDCVRSHYLASE